MCGRRSGPSAGGGAGYVREEVRATCRRRSGLRVGEGAAFLVDRRSAVYGPGRLRAGLPAVRSPARLAGGAAGIFHPHSLPVLPPPCS
jgi:hypothetical protein